MQAKPKNWKNLQKKEEKAKEARAKEERRLRKKQEKANMSGLSASEKKLAQQQTREAAKAEKSRSWSAGEDAILRKLFPIYKGSSSIFDVIANDPDLVAIGKNRSVAAVQKRCTELELHMVQDDSDDELEITPDASDAAPPAVGASPGSSSAADPSSGSKRKSTSPDAATGLSAGLSQLDDFEALEGKGKQGTLSANKRKKSKGLVKASASANSRGGLGSDDEALMDEDMEEEVATQSQTKAVSRRPMVLEDSDDE